MRLSAPFARPAKLLAASIFALFLCAPLAAQYTEVPATVKPGRFLLEIDALSLIHDREGSDRVTAVAAGLVLATTGLTSNWDLQVGAELFISQRYESGGFTDRNSGIGDLHVRTKWRFLENDMVSMALLPFVKIPTNSGGVGNDSLEGGLIVPWETYLPGDITVNAMVEVDFIRNGADDGYDTLWYASAAFTRALTSKLAIYGEFDAAKSSGGEPWQSTVGFGAYLTVSAFLAWDFAVYRGLSRGAPDWNPVVRVNIGF